MWQQEAVQAIHEVGARLGLDPRNIVKIMANESGCEPSAHNPGGAVGLIQFEPDTLRDEGWNAGANAFAALHAVEQMPYVYRYFAARKSSLAQAGGGLGALYTATFLPALTARAGDATLVLCGDHGPFAWAYTANRVFDEARKGWITVGDLVSAAERAYSHCPLAQQIVAALDALDAATPPSV
jgi:hypothetical protein